MRRRVLPVLLEVYDTTRRVCTSVFGRNRLKPLRTVPLRESIMLRFITVLSRFCAERVCSSVVGLSLILPKIEEEEVRMEQFLRKEENVAERERK